MTDRSRIIKIAAASAFFLLAALLAALFLIWQNNYRDRVYPGISVGDLALGGKTLAEARDLIGARAALVEQAGLDFKYGERTATLGATVVAFDSDLSFPALSFFAADTADLAYGREEERGFWHYLTNYLKPRERKNLKASYSLDEGRVRAFLAESFPDLNIDPVSAYFSLTADDLGGRLTRNAEKIGKGINYEAALAATREALDKLTEVETAIRTESKYPEVRQADLAGLESEARALADRGVLSISASSTPERAAGGKEQKWTVKPEQLITWVKAGKENGRLLIGLDEAKIAAYLEEEIAPQLDKDVVLPRFEIKDGKVTNWQTGADGYRLDRAATAARIGETLLAGQNETSVIMEKINAESLAADNDFRIKEIIGTGHSRFAGSPVNRRHNIKVGAASLHGLLIKPGENFSLLKALGTIDDTTGYRTELVIKGDKTVPEFGGGLCQIGTTVFRTALASGLPISERRNHSYRVAYYEPAGTDATIYDPAPDFRFINDTGNYILIQARLAGDDLYFDFWGVRDGRSATTTAPTIYNIVKPEPTKLIETTELAPGEKKCTESSHNGADAYFDYTVTYPEGATTTPVQTRRFNSHYIPWQAVCLVGVAATSTPAVTDGAVTEGGSPADGMASSTPAQ